MFDISSSGVNPKIWKFSVESSMVCIGAIQIWSNMRNQSLGEGQFIHHGSFKLFYFTYLHT